MPEMPPPAGGSKKPGRKGGEPLGGVLDETAGMAPDVARRLLEMNPKLREDGADTAWIVEQSKKKKAAPSAATAEKSAAASLQGRAENIFVEAKRQLSQEEKRLDADLA